MTAHEVSVPALSGTEWRRREAGATEAIVPGLPGDGRGRKTAVISLEDTQ